MKKASGFRAALGKNLFMIGEWLGWAAADNTRSMVSGLARRNREFVSGSQIWFPAAPDSLPIVAIHKVAMKCIFDIRSGVGYTPQPGIIALIFGIEKVGVLLPVEMVSSQRLDALPRLPRRPG